MRHLVILYSEKCECVTIVIIYNKLIYIVLLLGVFILIMI